MMHRAAARGAIDFSSADLLDRRFWHRLGFTLRTLIEDDWFELDKLEYQRCLAFFQVSTGSKEGLERTLKGLDASLDRMYDLVQPWSAEQRRNATRDLVFAMEDEWAAAWGGHPDDPEMAARIEAACRELRGETTPR
jgi:hypothetical protein